MRRKKREIAEGQQYRKRGGGGVWEVMALRRDGLGAVHAQLRRADDPKTFKTLSVATLLDSDQFERVET